MRRGWTNGRFDNRIILKVEGIFCHRLISECLEKKIYVEDVRYLDDLSMRLTVQEKQYKKFKIVARNRYVVTEIERKGVKFRFTRFFSKKSVIVGVGIFLFLVFYREQFVSDVYVSGLKDFPKEEFYQILADNGLYEGSGTNIDKQELKTALYEQIGDRINWINIEIKGTKAEVEVVEKAASEPTFDYRLPCDIVAKKDGYIMKYVAKNGNSLVKEGQSVSKGQVLISGKKSVEAMEALPPDSEKQAIPATKEEKFHAIGDFYARIIYHFNVNQERYEIIKKETGKDIYGIRVHVGEHVWNSYYLFPGFDRADEHVYTLLNFSAGGNPDGFFGKYFKGGIKTRFVVELLDYKEITAEKRERGEQEIAVHMKKIIRDYLKKEMPKSAIILKQDLKYDATPGTVKVTVNLETMEQIGTEKAI